MVLASWRLNRFLQNFNQAKRSKWRSRAYLTLSVASGLVFGYNAAKFLADSEDNSDQIEILESEDYLFNHLDATGRPSFVFLFIPGVFSMYRSRILYMKAAKENKENFKYREGNIHIDLIFPKMQDEEVGYVYPKVEYTGGLRPENFEAMLKRSGMYDPEPRMTAYYRSFVGGNGK